MKRDQFMHNLAKTKRQAQAEREEREIVASIYSMFDVISKNQIEEDEQ